MSRIRGTRGALSLTVVTAFAACSSGGTTVVASDGGGGNASCYLFELGTTCALALDPNGVKEVFFNAPGTGWNFVTISLTGSTTYARWVLTNGYTGSYDAQCDDPTYGTDQSCHAYIIGGTPYHVYVYELGGKAGTTNLTIYASANAPSLGSADKPVPVSTDSLLNLSVGAGGTSYFSFQAARSASQTVAVTGHFTALTWELFENPGYLHPIQQCLAAGASSDLSCAAPLTGGATYYLKVLEHAGAPQEFVLTIGSGAGNEGSEASPLAIAVGGPSRASTVGTFGHSFYTFTPDASGPHAMQLDVHSFLQDGIWWSYPADLGWTLFDDPGFAHPVAACRDYRGIGTTFEHCVATLVAGVPYYLRVDEQAGFPYRAYDLTVVHRTGGGGTSDGAIGAPVYVSSQPITTYAGWGNVAAKGSSFYAFQTASAASSYGITARSQTDDLYSPGSNLTWSLYADPSFSTELARCERATGIVAQSCLTPMLDASSTYYLRVDEHDGIPQSFGLSLAGGLAPPTATSVGSPLSIPIASTGVDVVQDTLSTGWYAFTTSNAGTYRITSNLATGDLFALVAWHLYDDFGFSHAVAHCFQSGPTRSNGTSCTVALAGGAAYYLKVNPVGAQSGGNLHLAVERFVP
jgi:hypothetical protein